MNLDDFHIAPLSYNSSGGKGDGHDGSVDLSPQAVGLSALVLLITTAISFSLDLGLHVQLFIAAIRMVVQLSVLGIILVPIFTTTNVWFVMGYAAFMLLIASIEAVSRPKHTYVGMYRNTLLAMTFTCCLIIGYILLVVFDVRPWWEAQYMIPMFGMLLGNTTSTISVVLSSLLDELSTRSGMDAIELQLSLGASRFEATEALIKRCVKMSLLPLLNTMSVMGLVSIPGMMTGQVLSGSDPSNAARYQMMIIFVITGSSGLASVLSVYAAAFTIIDSHHCFRRELLLKKEPYSGITSLIKFIAQPVTCLYSRLCCLGVENKAAYQEAEAKKRGRVSAGSLLSGVMNIGGGSGAAAGAVCREGAGPSEALLKGPPPLSSAEASVSLLINAVIEEDEVRHAVVKERWNAQASSVGRPLTGVGGGEDDPEMANPYGAYVPPSQEHLARQAR